MYAEKIQTKPKLPLWVTADPNTHSMLTKLGWESSGVINADNSTDFLPTVMRTQYYDSEAKGHIDNDDMIDILRVVLPMSFTTGVVLRKARV
jgi:hypothetical protein